MIPVRMRKKEAAYQPFDLALISVLAVSFFIRLSAVFSLQSFVLSGDENQYIDISFQILFNRLNPGFFQHGALYSYFVSFLYFLFYWFAKFTGMIPSASNYVWLFLEHREVFFMFARLVSVGFNLLTIVLVYKIAKDLADQKTGVVAACLFACLPFSISTALTASPYSATTFFILCSMFFFLKVLKDPCIKNFLWLGGVHGLAIASDFYAFILFPVYILVLCVKCYGHKFRLIRIAEIAMSLAVALAVFCLVNIYLVINFKDFLSGFASQVQTIRFSEYGHFHSKLYYIGLLSGMPYGMLVPFFLLCPFIKIKERPGCLVLWVFALLFLIFLSFIKIQLPIYMSHALPFIVLTAVVTLFNLIKYFAPWKRSVLWILYGCFFVFFSWRGFDLDVYNPYADEAGQWVRNNLPEGSKILCHPGIAYFPEQKAGMFPDQRMFAEALEKYYQSRPGRGFQMLFGNLVEESFGYYIEEQQVDYIVASERDYDAFAADWMATNAQLVKAYCLGSDTSVCPIRIYRVLK